MANIVGNLFKIIGGIALILITVWIGMAASSWGIATINVVKGGILIAVILIGLVLIFIGMSDLKSG